MSTIHDMDDAFRAVRTAIADSGLSCMEISRRSGVSDGTFYQWLNGRARGIRLDNLIRVLAACGWEIVIRRAEK